MWGKCVEKGTLVHCWWECKLVHYCGNSMKVSQKNKDRTTTICPSNSTPGYISEKNKDTNSKRRMQPNVHSSIIYGCQVMEAT